MLSDTFQANRLKTTKQKHHKKSLTSLLLVVFLINNIINIIFIKAQTSISDDDWPNSGQISDFLYTEAVIIENIKNYIDALDNKITTIKTKTREIRTIYDVALNDTGKYFGNPINTFHLIKRMSQDWETLRTFARQDVTGNIVKNVTRFSEILAFPSAEDLDEALEQVASIKDLHQLVSSQMAADGEFNDSKLRTKISWSDCLAVGKHSLKKKDYNLSRTWLRAALNKLIGDDDSGKANANILETMAKVEYKSGNLTEALRLAKNVLEINPDNTNSRTLQEKIIKKMDKNRKRIKFPKGKKILK